MIREMEVEAAPQGWILRIGGEAQERSFRTGAEAEAAAKSQACALAHAGEAVRLVVRLRDGSVGGRFLFPPRLVALQEPEPTSAQPMLLTG